MQDLGKKQSNEESNYEAKRDYQNQAFAQSYEHLRFGNTIGRLYSFLQIRTIGKILNLLPPGSKVLDLPCGTGRITKHLLQRGFKVYAGDISQAMLNIARERLSHYSNLEDLRIIDVEKIDTGDNEFEYTICIKLMHLVPLEIRTKMLKELSRVTENLIIVSYSCLTFGGIKRFIKTLLRRRNTISEFAITKVNLEQELNTVNLEIVKCYWTFRLLSEEVILLLRKKS